MNPLLSLSNSSVQLTSPLDSHSTPVSEFTINPSQPKSAQSIPSTSSLSIPSVHSEPSGGKFGFSQPSSGLHSGSLQSTGKPVSGSNKHVGGGGTGITSSVLGIPSSIPILGPM